MYLLSAKPHLVLDPRLSYKGHCMDFADKLTILEQIDMCQIKLLADYAPPISTTSRDVGTTRSTSSLGGTNGSPVKSFTSRFKSTVIHDPALELDDYFKLSLEDFETCHPLRWWSARSVQFPNLSHLARDILSIQGSAVAVEHTFSSGRDTIALRRSRLKPDTICTLMVF
jgi:hAT family C-terminal dimerisation region